MSPLYELLPQSKTINLGLDSDPGGYWWGSSPLGELPALRISAGGIWAHIQILLHWILLDTLLLTELEIGVMYLTRIILTRIIAIRNATKPCRTWHARGVAHVLPSFFRPPLLFHAETP